MVCWVKDRLKEMLGIRLCPSRLERYENVFSLYKTQGLIYKMKHSFFTQGTKFWWTYSINEESCSLFLLILMLIRKQIFLLHSKWMPCFVDQPFYCLLKYTPFSVGLRLLRYKLISNIYFGCSNYPFLSTVTSNGHCTYNWSSVWSLP